MRGGGDLQASGRHAAQPCSLQPPLVEAHALLYPTATTSLWECVKRMSRTLSVSAAQPTRPNYGHYPGTKNTVQAYPISPQRAGSQGGTAAAGMRQCPPNSARHPSTHHALTAADTQSTKPNFAINTRLKMPQCLLRRIVNATHCMHPSLYCIRHLTVVRLGRLGGGGAFRSHPFMPRHKAADRGGHRRQGRRHGQRRREH